MVESDPDTHEAFKFSSEQIIITWIPDARALGRELYADMLKPSRLFHRHFDTMTNGRSSLFNAQFVFK